jgi:competence protein ComEA
MKKLLLAVAAFITSMGLAFAAVDANTASQAELESIKGIGPAIAAKILDERKKGSFKDMKDLEERVKGIGEKNIAAMAAGGLSVGKGGAPKAEAKVDAKKDAPKAEAKADAKKDAPKAEVKKDAPKADAKADMKKDAPKADAKVDAKADAKKEAPKADAKKVDAKKDAVKVDAKPDAVKADAAKMDDKATAKK